MKEFKLRASAGGSLAGKRGLGKTGEKFIENFVKEQIYQRREEFSSKYTEKGNLTEEASIDYIADKLGFGFLAKNEDFFEDDYFTGTPDIVLPDLVIDMKNSWSPFTFPLFETEVPNDGYFYQGQIYMHLTGRRKFKLIYTLMDTPFDLIEKEARNFCYKNNEELSDDIIREFTEKMTFKDIDDKFRIKVFEFDYDETVIDFLKSRIEEARDYIKTFNL
jgi:hypothetical protein